VGTRQSRQLFWGFASDFGAMGESEAQIGLQAKSFVPAEWAELFSSGPASRSLKTSGPLRATSNCLPSVRAMTRIGPTMGRGL
jgi:hypothetical protein